MRTFAFFLPQFHAIPENDEWWGKDFTEWERVKAAEPLYNGHCQPLHPLDGNYYNLLSKDTVNWQTRLMEKYNITGLIYYHYYFSGKKLLEKPAENLLKWKDIKQPFFFCWANHSWRKTWNGSSELLVEQKYGDDTEWEKHFEYLLPFFRDDRYEKVDNKPLFMVFDSSFDEKERMMAFFDKKCRMNGFSGICWIDTCTDYGNEYDKKINSKYPVADYKVFLREPNVSKYLYSNEIANNNRFFDWKNRLDFKLLRKTNGVLRYDGEVLYNLLIKYYRRNEKIIHGLCLTWDNTARHGQRGYVITEPSKDRFCEYFNLLSEENYCFINAWNEWCEGMILEPTEENGYKYLEWIAECMNDETKG